MRTKGTVPLGASPLPAPCRAFSPTKLDSGSLTLQLPINFHSAPPVPVATTPVTSTLGSLHRARARGFKQTRADGRSLRSRLEKPATEANQEVMKKQLPERSLAPQELPSLHGLRGPCSWSQHSCTVCATLPPLPAGAASRVLWVLFADAGEHELLMWPSWGHTHGQEARRHLIPVVFPISAGPSSGHLPVPFITSIIFFLYHV